MPRKPCVEKDCKAGAIAPTDKCVKHGGGKRCVEKDCKASAIAPTDKCFKHGGGKRCVEKDEEIRYYDILYIFSF